MLKIERINENDLPDLADLYKELTGREQPIVKMSESFLKINENDAYFLLGAKIDGRLAGSIMGILCCDIVDDCRPFMVIENVIVSEKFRRHGVGIALLKGIEDICIEKNCYYSMLVSGIQREDAHKFYESAGYAHNAVRGFKKFFTNSNC